MLHKITVLMGIVSLVLVLYKLIHPSFELFTGFIFAWMGLFFLLLGAEELQKKSKMLGIVYVAGGALLIFLVLMQ